MQNLLSLRGQRWSHVWSWWQCVIQDIVGQRRLLAVVLPAQDVIVLLLIISEGWHEFFLSVRLFICHFLHLVHCRLVHFLVVKQLLIFQLLVSPPLLLLKLLLNHLLTLIFDVLLVGSQLSLFVFFPQVLFFDLSFQDISKIFSGLRVAHFDLSHDFTQSFFSSILGNQRLDYLLF